MHLAHTAHVRSPVFIVTIETTMAGDEERGPNCIEEHSNETHSQTRR